eukprot:1155748-Pelagomonas_calceolata.AAC.6
MKRCSASGWVGTESGMDTKGAGTDGPLGNCCCCCCCCWAASSAPAACSLAGEDGGGGAWLGVLASDGTLYNGFMTTTVLAHYMRKQRNPRDLLPEAWNMCHSERY